MVRAIILGVFAGCLLAQAPEKPPARVDRALRGRISEFYQDHVTGQFRKAEALVADDTKDFYYVASKPKYERFEILDITYSDRFTRAKATVLCEQIVVALGFGSKPVKFRVPSTWKLEKGKWYYYVDQKAPFESPFGKMAPAPLTREPAPKSLPVDVTKGDFIFNQVKADKQSLTLKPGESGEVTISNRAQGNMKVVLQDKVRGIDVQPQEIDIKAAGSAVVTFQAGDEAKSGRITLRVEQTGELLAVQVTVQK